MFQIIQTAFHKIAIGITTTILGIGSFFSGPANTVLPSPTYSQTPAIQQRIQVQTKTKIVTPNASPSVTPSNASAHKRNRLSNAEIIQKVKPTVVFISTQTEAGSGFIIDGSGIVLTNAHVVQGADTATIKLSDGRSYNGTVVGRNENIDLALIKISAGNLSVAEIGDSGTVAQGDSVYALGYPFGLEGDVSFTEGTISRKLTTGGATYFETSTQIHPGNSGGPLVNALGQVIGINTQTFGLTIGGVAIGETIKLAIPINTAESYLPGLKAGQNITKPQGTPQTIPLVTPTPTPQNQPSIKTLPSDDFPQYQRVTLNKYTNNPSAYINKKILITNIITQFLPQGGSGGTTNYVKVEDQISHVIVMIVFNNSSDYAAVADAFAVASVIKVYGIGSQSVSFTQGGQTVWYPVIEPRRIDVCPGGGGVDNLGPDPNDPWQAGCYGSWTQLLP